MPRNVRNFWIELSVDGKKTRVATGPRAKDGGFAMSIHMRADGHVRTGLNIVGYVCPETGLLMLQAENEEQTRWVEVSSRR